MKRRPMNEEDQRLAATPEVVAACAKLEMLQGKPDELTLEEIMRVYYLRPCRRVRPLSRDAKKYARGSLLVYAHETVIVVELEDDTLVYPHSGDKFVGGKIKRYKGLLPGSTFYTNGGVKVYFLNSKEEVTKTRIYVAAQAATQSPMPKGFKIGGLFSDDEHSKFRHPRCPQEANLEGRLAGERLLQAFRDSGPPEDGWLQTNEYAVVVGSVAVPT